MRYDLLLRAYNKLLARDFDCLIHYKEILIELLLFTSLKSVEMSKHSRG